MNSMYVLPHMWVFSMDDRSFTFLGFRGVFKVLENVAHLHIKWLHALFDTLELLCPALRSDYQKREENRRNSTSINGSSSLENDTEKPTIT